MLKHNIMNKCCAHDCDKKIYALGYCRKHYEQMRKLGKLKRTRFDKNEIIEHEDYAEIILYDRTGEENGRALISLNQVELVRDVKWRKTSHGYVTGSAGKNRHLFLHRYLLNPPDDKVIDHINGNRLDCRNENIRICNKSDNARNRVAHSTKKTSKYKGVSKDGNYPHKTVWRVQLKLGNKEYSARFYNEIVAANYYNHLAVKYHGDFAKLNEVPYFVSIEECEKQKIRQNETSSGYTGISAYETKKGTSYATTVYYNNKNHYIGTFHTLEEALNAQKCKLKELAIN